MKYSPGKLNTLLNAGSKESGRVCYSISGTGTGIIDQPQSAMIILDKLHFAYPDGQFVLQIPHVQFPALKSSVILGPSGSGKTTLLHLIAGILPVESGIITIGDACLTTMNDAERRLFRLRNVGLVFQDFQLIDYLSVLENVILPCRLHPSVDLTPSVRERALELLHSVGLSQLQRRPVTRLSQGERQRVAICRALLLSPQVVLADEPTGNLDPDNAEKIVKLLLAETRRSGATLIMVTHDHSLQSCFDQVIDFQQFRKKVLQDSDHTSAGSSTVGSSGAGNSGAGNSGAGNSGAGSSGAIP